MYCNWCWENGVTIISRLLWTLWLHWVTGHVGNSSNLLLHSSTKCCQNKASVGIKMPLKLYFYFLEILKGKKKKKCTFRYLFWTQIETVYLKVSKDNIQSNQCSKFKLFWQLYNCVYIYIYIMNFFFYILFQLCCLYLCSLCSYLRLYMTL